MSILLLLGLLLLGAVLYILISGRPASDLIVQLSSESELLALQADLDKQGIKTYAKNMTSQGLVARRGGEMGNPSLHVVDPRDYARACDLVRGAKTNATR